MAKKKQAPAMQAPQKLKLLITIVNREKADFYMDLIQTFEVNMQFRSAAKGTANSDILHMNIQKPKICFRKKNMMKLLICIKK